MVLPVSTRQNDAFRSPDTQAIKNCMQLARHSPETAAYWQRQAELKKLPKVAQIAQTLERYVNAAMHERHANHWQGKMPATQSYHLNHQLGQKAREDLLAQDKKDITFAVAIDEQAYMQYGFLMNGQTPTPAENTHLKNLMHAWLVGNQMMIKEGQLIHVSEDSTANQKVSPSAFSTALTDVHNGLEAFCARQGLNARVKQQTYQPQKLSKNIPKSNHRMPEDAAVAPKQHNTPGL